MARRRLVTVTAGLMVGASGLAGCGSSSKTTSPTSVPVTSAAPGSSTGSSASTGSAGSTGATGKGTVGTESSQYGTILQSGGRTLYELSADTPTKSNCTDSGCTAVWPPLTGSVTAGSGVDAAKLGHISVPGGTQQVTYGGHPLYFYVGDGGSGRTNGQGITSFGGTWHVVSASSGEAVTAPASGQGGSTTSTTKASSGYGGGY